MNLLRSISLAGIALLIASACGEGPARQQAATPETESHATEAPRNRLQYESSPYLLQHASNPVDWRPWGKEALRAARDEDKPIIVSIGYSTCHWCHVMEHESFEDERIAAFMNEHFICIKVDREERPDVDQLYMEACQAITGSGGWPLNAFLLPDARPFFAGTYFPPTPSRNQPGWLELLTKINTAWQQDRAELEKQAADITEGLQDSKALFFDGESDEPQAYDRAAIDEMIDLLKKGYDKNYGGFGTGQKFPRSQSLELLLDYGLLHQDEEAVSLTERAMRAMIDGGIYDQLRGGFSRYTVDEKWRIPHFEKMLYDNALLLRLLGKLQMSNPNETYRQTIQETIGWLQAEMQSPEGAFYSALDADSEGEEGKFYRWDHEELEELLTADELTLLGKYYGVTKSGNWREESTNVLYRSRQLPESGRADWEAIRRQLLERREQRVRPGRDEKVILQWNALLISGLCYAYRATGDESVRTMAQTAYRALRELLFKDNSWHRTATNGQLGEIAFLDDLTALNTARLDLYDITQDIELVAETERSVAYILENFAGAPGGLYYLTAAATNELPVQGMDIYDNALPSGNGQLLQLLRRLTDYTGRTEYGKLVDEKVEGLAGNVLKYPGSFANLGRLLLLLDYPTRELVISGPTAMEVSRELNTRYRPDLSIVVVTEEAESRFPIMEGRYSEDLLQLYLCKNHSCRMPVGAVSELEL